jgi:hypothetical protein
VTSLRGLYYPGESWDLDIEDSMLKKCLLFFDKIYAIVPEVFSVDWKAVQPEEELDPFLMVSRSYRQVIAAKILRTVETSEIDSVSVQQVAHLQETERHVRIIKFLDKVALLRKEGMLELVNPRENLLDPPYWGPKSGSFPWFDIDSSYRKIRRRSLSMEKLELHKPHVLYGSILSDLNDKGFRNLATKLGNKRVIVYKGQAEQNWLSLVGGSSHFEEDKWQQAPHIGLLCGSFSGTISTSMWAALVINHTLMTAHRYSLIPVTPSSPFWELLQHKVRRARGRSRGKQFDKWFSGHPEYKADFCTFSLATCILPNFELLSFEDVLDLRASLKDELAAFRHKMSILVEYITTEPWEPNFLSEVQYTVKRHIEPVVEDLRRKAQASPNEIVLRALGNAQPTVLPILAGIWAGMPPLLLMAVAAGLVSMKTAIENYLERKKVLQSNGLTLLLQL